MWVPGRSCVKVNSTADALATLWSKTAPVSPKSMMEIYESPIKRNLRDEIYS